MWGLGVKLLMLVRKKFGGLFYSPLFGFKSVCEGGGGEGTW